MVLLLSIKIVGCGCRCKQRGCLYSYPTSPLLTPTLKIPVSWVLGKMWTPEWWNRKHDSLELTSREAHFVWPMPIELFPDRWTGCRGTIEWALRSSDLAPRDFFVRGFVKDAVSSTKSSSLNQVRSETARAFGMISLELCKQVSWSGESRLQKCIKANSWHFEKG